MKAVSGKFHPIFQWFYFDSVESLPENLPLPAEEVDLQVRSGMLTLRLSQRFALVYLSNSKCVITIGASPCAHKEKAEDQSVEAPASPPCPIGAQSMQGCCHDGPLST